MKINAYHGLGNHLIIDAYECDKDRLNDIEFIKTILNELPDIIKVKKLSEPTVISHTAENPEESGITGYVIIAESHISIHTYPEKSYFSFDVFSCREFDTEKILIYLKQKLNPEKFETHLFKRGHTEKFNADEKLEKIKGIKFSDKITAKELISQYKNIGFGATHLGKSIEVIKNMKKDNATIFLSFTSNMVSSGLREVFAELAKRKLIHVIITSTGSIEEDIMKTKKPFLLGDFNADDADLHKKGINRIGNIFVPDDRYELLEDFLMPFFDEMHERQKQTNKLISPSELIFELGKKLNDEKSILYWASKNNIPIFCPGITDGALGLQLY
ncbi:adenosylmethionine decarboxylase, partial [Candidatus Woesearchaeota archaeon]|nr:adenosylmethionine decarboxylase [Candidatus Woesearchaeota archaeon]